jgi:hypothetical protein
MPQFCPKTSGESTTESPDFSGYLSNTQKEALGSPGKRQLLKGAENKPFLTIEEKRKPQALTD